MNQSELEAFIENLENVQRDDNFGFIFYFVGDDHRLPFATIGFQDNDYDKLSNLNREGVYRLNMGVSKASYQSVIDDNAEIDYTALNVFMPHPDYAKMHYLCILNPTADKIEITKNLLIEAHSIASKRAQRKTS